MFTRRQDRPLSASDMGFGNDVGNSMGLDDRIKVRDYLDAQIGDVIAQLNLEIKRLDQLLISADRRYEDRWKSDQQALKDALQAAKEAVAAALQAAKEAVGKAENASDARFEVANNVKAELDRKYSELIAETVTRLEFDAAAKESLRQFADTRDSVRELVPLVARLEGTAVSNSEKLATLSSAQIESRSHSGGVSDQESKQARDTEARFTRFAQTIYAILAAMSLVVALTAAHII
jgi:hypothetical protein